MVSKAIAQGQGHGPASTVAALAAAAPARQGQLTTSTIAASAVAAASGQGHVLASTVAALALALDMLLLHLLRVVILLHLSRVSALSTSWICEVTVEVGVMNECDV